MSNKKRLEYAIKVLIGGLLAWAIYRQVFARENAAALWAGLIGRFVSPHYYWLLVVVLLAPVNVALESLKWQGLIRSFSPLGFGRVFKAVLSGITIAIFTPNRVGEYGGRILYVAPENNWKAIIATLVGSLAQLLVILSAGLVGLVVFSSHFLQTELNVLPLLVSLTTVVLAGMYFCFFNIDLLIPIVKRIPFIHLLRRYFKHLLVLKHYGRGELWEALALSFLRYLTYSLQYYFLLKFYGIPASLLPGLAGIATIFFIQASLPLPPLMGLLARGEIALFVWGFFSADQVGILAATFTLFVINIAVPALLGMAFIAQANILQSFGYDKNDES